MFENTMGVARKYGSKAAAAVAVVPFMAGNAMAELPPEVATATTAYKTDGLAAIGMVMVASIALWGLRKLAAKMGWF